MRIWCSSLLFACVITLDASPCAAQSATMQDVVRFLVTNQSVQTGETVKDRAAAAQASDTIGRALLAAASALPTSASSAGFVYRFNPALGTVERATESFGPEVVERASTSGRGRIAIGGTWQYRSFNRLEGRDLRAGTLATTSTRFADESTPYDVETLTLRVRSVVATGFATVGVTDRFDLGVAVPFARLTMEGLRTDTYRGTSWTQASASASSSGFGDVALRGKYLLASGPAAALAVAGEWRLPSGREADLLGAGSASGRVFAVLSSEQGRVGAHANVGVGWGGVTGEILFAGAVTLAAAPRVTLSGELSGRRLSDVGRVVDATAPHPEVPGVLTTRLSAEPGGTTVALAGGSIKWNVASAWLLKAGVLLPASDAGLTSRVTLTLGLDYAIGR